MFSMASSEQYRPVLHQVQIDAFALEKVAPVGTGLRGWVCKSIDNTLLTEPTVPVVQESKDEPTESAACCHPLSSIILENRSRLSAQKIGATQG